MENKKVKLSLLQSTVYFVFEVVTASFDCFHSRTFSNLQITVLNAEVQRNRLARRAQMCG